MSGHVKKVKICKPLEAELTVTSLLLTTDANIPAGSFSYSIWIETGTAIIDGIAKPEGYSLSQPPQSFGDQRFVYPLVALTSITGQVHIIYVTP